MDEMVHVLDHPLLQHKLSILRDESTGCLCLLYTSQQGLAVGQAGVEEGLGQEGFVLAQGHGGRRGGGFQG